MAERREKTATGSEWRDITGAWLVCALVAAIALAVSGDLHKPPASAPMAMALLQPTR
jgi:hypothetical protein